MKALFDLPLFSASLETAPDPDIAKLEAEADAHPCTSGFAYFQDEQEMARYFALTAAARRIYGKAAYDNEQIPAAVRDFLHDASETGVRAMTAAQYREDSDAKLDARIAEYEADLAKPAKKHGGKKRRSEDEDDELEPNGEDMNRKILREWLDIAIAERERRRAIPNFNHLADIEQRAKEKFGEDGFHLVQQFVALDMTLEAHDFACDVLVDGLNLQYRHYEYLQEHLRQGDVHAAERFINKLKTTRQECQLSTPPGVTITMKPSRKSEKELVNA